ncbi:MAG: GTPase ObgE [Spirochaetaceae bacterium]|nr:GTPase ObgE [Spirochaetaceae bacterium]
MIRFSDETIIQVSSGKGGNGCIAFRREKYIPNGGPSGGDGGKGGDVVFAVKKNLRTLTHLHHRQHFKAKNGGDGSGNKRFGKDGENATVFVPPGTIITDAQTGEFIAEFAADCDEDQSFLFLEGGKGGWGNIHFKSSVNQAPRRANPGAPGETREVKIELSIIADVGLVGFPNAGKSSLLNYFTNARPKIAPYPFTTKIPNLGVLHTDQQDIIIADIPGIIENAGDGKGLGTRFLKHISRTSLLIFMIDIDNRNFLTALDTLKAELQKFSPILAEKPYIILANKMDLPHGEENFSQFKEKYPNEKIVSVSVAKGWNMDEAKKAITELVFSGTTQKPKRSKFLETRSVTDGSIQYPGQEWTE